MLSGARFRREREGQPQLSRCRRAVRSLKAIRVGTAGWSLPRASASPFAGVGSQLKRYAGVLDAVEINSSFYRPHRRETYERWAGSTPDGFRFAVKLPKAATHEQRLADCGAILDRFAEDTAGLGPKRGPVLIQLPPSLKFDAAVAAHFFGEVADRFGQPLACEPRHASWFTPEAEALFIDCHVARVAADPPRAPGADRPGGWTGLSYWRLHGSPEIYRTPYGDRIVPIINDLAASPGEAWCLFDNTMTGAATADALAMRARLTSPRAAPPSRTPSRGLASAVPPPADRRG